MAHAIRPGLPQLPATMRHLEVDERGYPVPWFVHWVDGKPDHRLTDTLKRQRAFQERLCWICGVKLPGIFAYVTGTLAAFNLISGEPPSHPDCAYFAVKACPFLSNPDMRRRDDQRKADAIASVPQPGIPMMDNPGVSGVWVSDRSIITVYDNGDRLWKIPAGVMGVSWWYRGRKATPDEVGETFNERVAIMEEDARGRGEQGMMIFRRKLNDAYALYLPEFTPRYSSSSAAKCVI